MTHIVSKPRTAPTTPRRRLVPKKAADPPMGEPKPVRRVIRPRGAKRAAVAPSGAADRAPKVIVRDRPDPNTEYSTGDRWKPDGAIRQEAAAHLAKLAELGEYRYVPLNRWRKGWPKVQPKAIEGSETVFVCQGQTFIGFATRAGGVWVGWDICGHCQRHVLAVDRHHGAVVPPRGVVYVYRQREHLPMYDPTKTGYVGLEHDQNGKPLPVVVASPEQPVDDSELPKPKTKPKIIRRKK